MEKNIFKPQDLYVSPDGNDKWSGSLPEPDENGTDGPFASLKRARDEARRRKANGEFTGPFTVWIRGGRYFVEEPLEFGVEDSIPVRYAAYPGESPALDGGRKIEGWRIIEHKGRTCWVAELPEVAKGKWYFRQLFVNGCRRPRPCLPKQGYYRMEAVPGLTAESGLFDGSDMFQCGRGDIQKWTNLCDIDIVALHYWIEERMPVASFDSETCIVKSARRSGIALRDDSKKELCRYYVENVFEALSEPGEWYLDRSSGLLYYLPLPGEAPGPAEVYAPVAVQLLTIKGQPEKEQYVEFLSFEGLSFCNTEWFQPGDGAASGQAAASVPGVITFHGARSCSVRDCTIKNVGIYGIDISEGCRGIQIVGNYLSDLGGGGVKLTGSDASGLLSERTGFNTITDNTICQGGRVFMSAVGILCMHSCDNVLSHNHIHDFYYSGISAGWTWGYQESVARNNLIEKNRIHNLGQGILSDMGGIYLLGVQPGTVVRGNLIYDVEEYYYGGWGIYPDEGTSHVLIEDNVCCRINGQAFHQHYGRENILRNNIFAFCRNGMVSFTRGEKHISFTFERNIVLTDGTPLFLYVPWKDINRPMKNIYSDLNLFWDVNNRELTCRLGGYVKLDTVPAAEYVMAQWQELGYDRHSLAADPLFADPAAGDFSLNDKSPALQLGFKPIDLSDVGPRKKEQFYCIK